MLTELRTLTGQHFSYAYGRMGVLKLLLLEQTDIDRMLGARDIREVEKILTEVKLTNVIDQGISEGHAIIEAVGTWMRGEVEQMSPKEKREVFHILWLENDAPYISYLLKKHHGFTAEISKEPLSGMSAYDQEELQALVTDEKAGTLLTHVIQFVSVMRTLDNLTAREIDTAVAQYTTKTQKQLAKVSGSAAIERYLEHQIDLKNIRTALRLTEEDALPYLLEGGTIPNENLAGSLQDIISAITRSPLAIYLPKDIESILTDPVEFEKSAAHITATDVSKMWNVPLSIEPLFAFAAITVNQLKLIRTILIAKGNELSPQETKHMLPPFLTASSYAS